MDILFSAHTCTMIITHMHVRTHTHTHTHTHRATLVYWVMSRIS